MNGKEYGFQKELATVGDWRTMPGWFSTEKGEFIQKQIRDTYNRLDLHGHWFEILDLGSWKGKSGTCMATALPVDKRSYVWCVDHWRGSPGERETNHVQAGIRPLSVLWEFLQYTSHLGVLGGRMGLLTLPSGIAVEYFTGKQFSFMFIDGDHEGALQDIRRWLPKLKIGGTLIGDDLNWPLVRADVNTFMRESGDSYGIEYSEHNVNGPVYRMVRTK